MPADPVQPVAVVLTISDSCARGDREDLSGPALVRALETWGARIAAVEILPDDRPAIASRLRHWCDSGTVHLVATTGGTGFSPRDVTPEATRDVIERDAPGLAELMRLRSLDLTPTAALSRSVCGIRGRTLVLNLPGSPKGAVECFEAVAAPLVHGLKVLTGEAIRCGG